MENIYCDNWERELDCQFLIPDRCREKAYICSPLSADQDGQMLENMRTARAYMFYAMKKMNLAARAPHAYLPMLLCDRIPAERVLGLQFGLRLLESCDRMLVCGNRISRGMRGEIEKAAGFGVPITVFDEALLYKVQKIVTQSDGEKNSVRLDRENPAMASGNPISFLERQNHGGKINDWGKEPEHCYAHLNG